MTNDILIFAEQRNDQLHPAVLQLLTPARALAGQSGGRVVGVVLGADVSRAADALAAAGVERLLTVTEPSLALYSALAYRAALAAAISQADPRVVLLPATFMGRDLAPRVAVRLKGALATDVVALELAADGALDVRRPLYNGKAYCHVKLPAGRVALATVRLNTFPAGSGAGAAERQTVSWSPDERERRCETREIARTGGEIKDVTEADIVVSGGRSLKSEENFQKLIYPLALALDGAVGASRAACDAGYQPHSRQVGLTGKTVTPKLYIACGISGAIQHLAGMRGSKVIVAINTDKEAPITKVADYTVIGDLFQVVPALTEEVRRLHSS